MSGNVLEWTRSLYKPYPYRVDDGRENLGASDRKSRVVRGGSFDNLDRSARAAYRSSLAPGYRYRYLGFRVVVSCSRS